jgi:hypothetical protein
MWSADSQGDAVPVTSREGKAPLSNARRCKG